MSGCKLGRVLDTGMRQLLMQSNAPAVDYSSCTPQQPAQAGPANPLRYDLTELAGVLIILHLPYPGSAAGYRCRYHGTASALRCHA